MKPPSDKQEVGFDRTNIYLGKPPLTLPLFWENSDEKNVTGREFQKFGKMAELSGSKINVTDLETPNKIFNFRSDYWSF